MQISKEDVLISVAGAPKLNDGKWHTVSGKCCSLPFTSIANPFAQL